MNTYRELNLNPGAVNYIDVGTPRAPGLSAVESMQATHVAALKQALATDPDNVEIQKQLHDAQAPIDWAAQRNELALKFRATTMAMSSTSTPVSQLSHLIATHDALRARLIEIDRWIMTTKER